MYRCKQSVNLCKLSFRCKVQQLQVDISLVVHVMFVCRVQQLMMTHCKPGLNTGAQQLKVGHSQLSFQCTFANRVSPESLHAVFRPLSSLCVVLAIVQNKSALEYRMAWVFNVFESRTLESDTSDCAK